ncbi:hypothetical protein, partial [Burkholderia sp. E168m23]|uniref:hypothetical protein n=1 Tax=Burkholderia sp. E168m23 TaxID=1561200 RepID=UPI001F436B47
MNGQAVERQAMRTHASLIAHLSHTAFAKAKTACDAHVASRFPLTSVDRRPVSAARIDQAGLTASR